MNRPAWLLGIFAIAMLFVRPSYGQVAYGLSSVTYDPGSNAVDSISETELDYTAAYYYDPYVEGYLYDEANTDTPVASGTSSSEAWANCVPSSVDGPCLIAYVSLSAQATSGHSYDVDSEHYVIAYYEYTDSSGVVEYDDPYDFSSSFAPGDGGDYGGSFEDIPTYSTTVYLTEEYIYLGSTGALASTTDVTPWIDSISPSTFNPGTQNNVTIIGGGFGQNPSLDFAPGNGLSYTIMSATANTINLVLNVASTATPGSRSVDVSSNGASGQGFLSGSGVSTRSNPTNISISGTSCSYTLTLADGTTALNGQLFYLGSDLLTTTIPLRVTESTNNPNCSSSVNWRITFTYRPSRGTPSPNPVTLIPPCGKVNAIQNFTTPLSFMDPLTQKAATQAGIGGQGVVSATVAGGPQGGNTITATIYVLGTSMPHDTVTQMLNGLYSGPTFGLMTGIAYHESTYQQFIEPGIDTPPCNAANSNAYQLGPNGQGPWPHEDCKYHGSHVGLMMIPTDPIYNQQRYGFDAMRDGYSWIKDAQDGVNFFNGDKTAIAHQLEQLWMKLHPQLPALTPAQIEKDIVVEYGDSPARFNSRTQTITMGAYWVPDPSTNNTTWMENKQGNPGGWAYADFVFSHIQQ